MELYSAKLDERVLDPTTYSARHLRGKIHYRIVRCKKCGLIRSDPVADPALLAGLYGKSEFSYDEEVQNLRLTYGRYLARLERFGVRKGRILEIGGGSGFLLEEALRQGYQMVRGVDPSETAVACASSAIRPSIVCDILRPGLFGDLRFDVICMFQTLEHIPDPGALLEECSNLLEPGGLLLCLNHNVEALSARLLGESSPIVDVGHNYLYGTRTIRSLFQARGLEVLQVSPAYNIYSVYYLCRLLPLPSGPKSLLLRGLRSSRLGKLRLTVSLGNLFAVAQKPRASTPPGT